MLVAVRVLVGLWVAVRVGVGMCVGVAVRVGVGTRHSPPTQTRLGRKVPPTRAHPELVPAEHPPEGSWQHAASAARGTTAAATMTANIARRLITQRDV